MATTTRVPLDKINLDPALAVRAWPPKMRAEAVREYKDALEMGAEFPPIEVYLDGHGVHWCGDGSLRVEAHIMAKHEDIACRVIEGTRSDAVKHAAGSNVAHGFRRTRQDKAAAVQALLSLSDWKEKSSRAIAEACNVSHPFVEAVRASTGNVASERVGRDAQKRPVAGDADEGKPATCKRCARVGAMADCPACKKLQEQQAQRLAKRGPKPTNGRLPYDFRPWRDGMGLLVRQVDVLGKMYGAKDSPEASGFRRRLAELEADFKKWHLTLSRPKKKESA